MRQINKSEPEFFTDFIRDASPQNWDDFTIGYELREHMLRNEQNWQCAYTELSINQNNNSSHIDHFKRKHSLLFPQLMFDYSNLFTACQFEGFGAKYKDRKVKTINDYNDLLSPLTQDLASHFEYNIDTGEIEGKTPKARYTMETFNLNHDTLIKRRKETAKIALSYITQFDEEDTIQFIGEFESMIRYIYTVNNN